MRNKSRTGVVVTATITSLRTVMAKNRDNVGDGLNNALDMSRRVEGPQGGQTVAEYLNRMHLNPLVKRSCLPPDVEEEVLETLLNACDTHPWDNQRMALYVKRALDARLGAMWHVVIGTNFAFHIDFEHCDAILVYYGSVAMLAWKCGDILLQDIKYRPIK